MSNVSPFLDQPLRSESEARHDRHLSMMEVIRRAAKAEAQPQYKPCPWCGTDAPLPTREVGMLVYTIRCGNEDCYAQPSVYGATIEQAWSRWNSRA
jgi:hypothetical protein